MTFKEPPVVPLAKGDGDSRGFISNRSETLPNLARTEGLMLQYLTRLAEIGNIEAAMTAARERMTTAEEAFVLAKTLPEQDHVSEALACCSADTARVAQAGA